MELKFLGKGSAFNPAMKNTSAYFMYERSFFLIDCGESVFEQIYRSEELRGSDNIYVLITHLHADHVGSLGSLISYCRYVLGKYIHVIHPSGTIAGLLTLLGIDGGNYRYHREFPEDLAAVKVTAVPVDHVPDMDCYGYLISAAGETVYYSGDASGIPRHILSGFLSGQINRCYQDTCCQRSNHPTHCYIGDLEQAIPPEKRAAVSCMHLDGECRELLRAKGFDVVEVEGC